MYGSGFGSEKGQVRKTEITEGSEGQKVWEGDREGGSEEQRVQKEEKVRNFGKERGEVSKNGRITESQKVFGRERGQVRTTKRIEGQKFGGREVSSEARIRNNRGIRRSEGSFVRE